MDTRTKPRYGIDAYVDWVRAEGIPIHEGLLVDMVDLETSDWARYGVKGAVAHLDGRGDFCSMFKIELPPGRSTTPQRHLYEEVIYVVAASAASSGDRGACSRFRSTQSTATSTAAAANARS